MRLVLAAALCLAAASHSAAAEDLLVNFANGAGESVTAVLATPNDGGGDPVDLLAGAALEAGDMRDVVIANGRPACLYDLAITFESGLVRERSDTDFCATAGFIIE